MSPLMSRKEVADYLQVSVSRLASGWGPKPLPIYKRPVKYLRSDVDKWLLAQVATPTVGQEVLQWLEQFDVNDWEHASGWVYFVRPSGLGRVKIGHSLAPRRRLKELATGSPAPLELVDLWRGPPALEAALHSAFKLYRIHLEWFDYCPPLQGLLASSRASEFRDPESPYGR